MFKFKYVSVLVMLCVNAVFSIDGITKAEAVDLVVEKVMMDSIGYSDVYVSLYPIEQETVTLANEKPLACAYDRNWVFFIDDSPFTDWQHPCRYVFVDVESGNYQIIDDNFYPKNLQTEYELVFEIPRPASIDYPSNQNLNKENFPENENLYAVIISGFHREYFWNDCSAIYCTLLANGYTKENILVHYCDGEGEDDWSDDLDGGIIPSDDVDAGAYKTSIQETFQFLKTELNPDDQLFIYMTCHGATYKDDGETVPTPSAIVLAGGDILCDFELAEYIKNINCAQMIFILQPCISGGFIDDIVNYDSYNPKCRNRNIQTSV